MFQKPGFGANTSGFGMQSTFGASPSTSASPFGGFKPATATSAFGAPPAFGANTSTQPTTGGGLFGTSNTSGGLFGGSTTAAPAPAFGAPSTGFSFGAGTSSAGTGGLFASNTSTGLFGNTQQNNAFGAKPAGFGFGSTTTNQNQSSGLFGTTSTTGTSLFGQQTNTLGGGGLFSNTAGGFGQQQQAPGTGHVKYNPVVGTDVVVKGGASQTINIKHHCITCMKEYESKSLEELRLEDYTAGRKGNAGGMFPLQQQQGAKPLFGGTTTFGQPATTSAPSVFGGGLTTGGAFGQNNSFSFGNNPQTSTNTTGLFGANKPTFGAATGTGTGLFGAPATTQAPAFGTNTSTFGFGNNLQNQTTGGGLFGAKPSTSVFGTQPASTGFGAGFGSGGLFGAKPLQTQAPTFGAPQQGIGTQALGFGTNTSTTGLFGGANAFGKPTTTQPTFGFGATQPLSLGGGLGGNAFQNKSTTQPFGQLGGSNMFQTNNNNTFRTGLDSGLGGGMFNNSGLGNTSLGLGMNANNNALANLSGSSAAGNVHEQILTLAARPYGDSPLFKDLLPDSSTTAEDVLKPTNPAAMKAVLDRQSAAYRVTSPLTGRLNIQPRTALANDKKSLFDGLEESDASLEDKLSLKPSRKRLVLRPNQRSESHNGSVDDSRTGTSYRSQEELPQAREMNGDVQTGDKENTNVEQTDGIERANRNNSFPDTNNLDASSDRQGSWLNSSKLSWNDNKEKAADNEPAPRLYPSLDKDLTTEGLERRASWLTTKPLRKPLVPAAQCVERSVRELGVRCGDTGDTGARRDKENVVMAVLPASEESPPSPREAPPHPAGVKLTRPGYYTIPTLEEMVGYIRPDGSCIVPHLTIGRTNYGNVYYDSEVNVTGLDLDSLVHFLNKEVIVYPEDADKPPVGEGLNKRAIVTLDRIWPRDKTENRPITDPDRLWEYEKKLRRVCDKHDTKFIEYRPQTGSWVFRVEHFSKYGLTDSDEEDDITPEVMKRQLVNQGVQKSAAPVTAAGLGGLSSLPPAASDSILAMQQASLNILNGARGAFEMDTTEDNESQSLYQDNKAFGVKSPTSELARLEHRQSHHVQLMKASLYTDTEVEDDVSTSTGDQLVPMSGPLLSLAETGSVTRTELKEEEDVTSRILAATEEVQMRPLIVRPHTIVLRYHRKVPPFKLTIAGRLEAAPVADMSVCRARHSRVGFGAGGTIAFTTSYDSIVELPKSAELCDLDKYTRGRLSHDWSEPVVARLALQQVDQNYIIQEILGRQLETLFKYSEFVEPPPGPGRCDQLRVTEDARGRLAALRGLVEDAAVTRGRKHRFGVSGAYCYEVWKLCDALWGADLENDGIPGTDDLSIVNRHKKLLEWMTSAVDNITDEELSKPRKGEPEDENDGHSARIWTLLLGGRILEACKLARDHGDLNMAALIAQAAGDPTFQSLVKRQLSLWRECGADTLISSHKLAVLRLIAGIPPIEHLALADWKQALHATARYLCPQVPSLERILRTYEGFFTASTASDTEAVEAEEAVDLTTVDGDEMCMQFPLPPYATEYDVVICQNGKRRRILDLRYELIRARAFNTRPALSPAHYTRDPLDHSLSFPLGVWLGAQSGSDAARAAEQLEAAGAWHLAVQALCYHPDHDVRGHLIRNVLSRHAPARVDSPEMKARLELIKKLRIPEKWLLLAQAHRAKYEHLPALEAEYLVAAEQWNSAHKVVVEQLLPEAVLADKLESVAPLLRKMNDAAQEHRLSGWSGGAQALYHYLHVCHEIRSVVVSSEAGSVGARLEGLRPALAAACRALAHLTNTSPRHAAARAEMGARLVQLALAAGEPPHHLAALLNNLKLPPDCTANAQYKITSDLAEQASELCIESASSSPISSHHRATAAS